MRQIAIILVGTLLVSLTGCRSTSSRLASRTNRAAIAAKQPSSAPKIDESVQTSSYETPIGDSGDDAVSIPPLTVRVPQSSAPSARSMLRTTSRANSGRPTEPC